MLNSNGIILLSFCAENDLTITNTLFRQVGRYKTTRMHPRSKPWHLIDYAICRRRDIRDVRISRVMQGAGCRTDHRLIKYVLSLHITPMSSKTAKSYRPAFDSAKLKQLERSCMFAKDLHDCPRTIVWTPISTVGTTQDSTYGVGQADHRTKEESLSGLVR